MERYITSGRCPYCGVVILSIDYVSRNRAHLRAAANGLESLGILVTRALEYKATLAPPGVKAKVTITGPTQMQCLSCMRTWLFSDSTVAGLASSSTQLQTGITPSAPFRPGPSGVPWPPSISGPRSAGAPGPFPSQTSRNVDLSGCVLVGVAEEKQVEKFLREERRKYRNNSGSTVTRELDITSSITLTVTIESSKLQSHDVQAGVTLLGFAAIHGQVQRQLSERYSVTLQSTSSVSDKTSVTLKPYMTVEHVIQWKLVAWIGTALLGKPASMFPRAIAKVPYQVPVRLTYDDDLIDVKNVQVKKKRD